MSTSAFAPFLPSDRPPLLEASVRRVRTAVARAVERTLESLSLEAMSTRLPQERDELLSAQHDLNRKAGIFLRAFEEVFDELVDRASDGAGWDSAGPSSTMWASLESSAAGEVEVRVAARQVSLELSRGCTWEIRDVDAYMRSLLPPVPESEVVNPVGPMTIALALVRAMRSVTEGRDQQQTVLSRLARALAEGLRQAYLEITHEMQRQGIQPASRTAVTSPPAPERASRSRPGPLDTGPSTGSPGSLLSTGPSTSGLQRRRSRDGKAGWNDSTQAFGLPTQGGAVAEGRKGGELPFTMGIIDSRVTALLRKLAAQHSKTAAPHDEAASPVNLLRLHRDALRLATGTPLDHLLIDTIASLFDEIFCDPKVPLPVARALASLQLPVLRAALGDASFFASRKHPLRRFVNRIASVGAAFDDIGEESARRCLAKVQELVREVVGGDFEDLSLYQGKMSELEAFVAEQGRLEIDARNRAAELLAAKEDEVRRRALYADQLEADLRTVEGPDFIRHFIAHIWSTLLFQAATGPTPDNARLAHLRQLARELFLSTLPKVSHDQRKAFLQSLPKLMKELSDGLDAVGWPEASRRAFFGQLLPSHADSLRAPPMSMLNHSLITRRIDSLLSRPVPTLAEARAAGPLPRRSAVPWLSPDEAAQVGFVDESSVDWKVDVQEDGLESAPPLEDSQLPGLPSIGEPAEPTSGAALARHVQLGAAYMMLLHGRWEKVRLSHVSAGRGFFVFTHGRDKSTLAITQRMLQKLCESGRLRAFEAASLLERAAARARQQLGAADSRA